MCDGRYRYLLEIGKKIYSVEWTENNTETEIEIRLKPDEKYLLSYYALLH